MEKKYKYMVQIKKIFIGKHIKRLCELGQKKTEDVEKILRRGKNVFNIHKN